MTKTARKAEYGDFQTPAGLAQAVCDLLFNAGIRPVSLLEPTCGSGNLLFAGLDRFGTIKLGFGLDINATHIRSANSVLDKRDALQKVKLVEADFFDTDWKCVLDDCPQPILILGNPPWVTSAHLGTLRSENLPDKSNFQNHNGLDAITGKANFDISEWMLIRLIDAMNGRVGTLAMLCKSAVARKVLRHAWKNGISVEGSIIYRIDAEAHFDAAVDAVLLVTHFRPSADDTNAKVYKNLGNAILETIIGYEDEVLLANAVSYRQWKHMCGESSMRWRSGIKHDCSKVMEVRREGTKYRNGYGELTELEEICLYPMLKSSDVAKGRPANGHRWMIVPQKTVGEETDGLRDRAPKTWAYLIGHAERLSKRASSIYRGRPQFSVFGVGDYSFSAWKVAISGFYKKLTFMPVGLFTGKPTVFDDTVYFLSFQMKDEAEYIATLLNSRVAQELYGAFVFWDSKRPITVDLLRRLNLCKLAKELGSEQQFNRLFAFEQDTERSNCPLVSHQLELWA